MVEVGGTKAKANAHSMLGLSGGQLSTMFSKQKKWRTWVVEYQDICIPGKQES
jgi:hypothetical protein